VPLIIDGYNLVFAYRGMVGGKSVESSRKEMLALLRRYQALSLEKITVVFDGSKEAWPFPRKEPSPNLTVVFSSPEQEADHVIMDFMDHCSAKRRLTVVSSDRQIRNHADRLRVRSAPAGAFMVRVVRRIEKSERRRAHAEPREKFIGLSGRDVAYWKKFLGLEDLDNGT